MSSDPEPPDDSDAERSVSSIPLETEDGDTVVIAQQNAGPGQQVGAGEFKRDEEASSHKSPEQAAGEQERLDDELEDRSGNSPGDDDHE